MLAVITVFILNWSLGSRPGSDVVASSGLMQPHDTPLGLGPPGAGPGAAFYPVPAHSRHSVRIVVAEKTCTSLYGELSEPFPERGKEIIEKCPCDATSKGEFLETIYT